jgi:hypothetical protein
LTTWCVTLRCIRPAAKADSEAEKRENLVATAVK